MNKSKSQLMIVACVGVVTAAAFAALYLLRPTAPVEKIQERVERLEVITAKKMDVFPTVNTQAVVESSLNINIKSQVSGQVVCTSPRFESGGIFDTGEVIMRIDPSDYELALIQAEVNVAKAQQTLSVELEQTDLAKIDWEKYGQGEATDLVLRIPQLREAEAGLKGAQANYDTQRIRLERTAIKAPFPLMIDQKQVDLGQIVSVNQDLVKVFGTEEAEIRMPLSQKQLDLLNVRNVGILPEEKVLNVKVRDLTREDGVVWDAQILRLDGSVDRKSRVYYAVATIYDPINIKYEKETPPLLPGVFVNLEVFGPKISNVFKVPAMAMRDDDNIFIYADNKLITKRVEILDRDQSFITIKSGINEGDYIVPKPPYSYVPGMKAMIASIDGVQAGGGRGGGRPSRGGAGRPGIGVAGIKAVEALQPSVGEQKKVTENNSPTAKSGQQEGGR